MATITMQVLDEPLAEDAKVVTAMHARPGALLTGGGRTTLKCGGCGFRVGRRVDPETVGALVLQCPRCCRFNELQA